MDNAGYYEHYYPQCSACWFSSLQAESAHSFETVFHLCLHASAAGWLKGLHPSAFMNNATSCLSNLVVLGALGAGTQNGSHNNYTVLLFAPTPEAGLNQGQVPVT